jgi:hypothetical protein
MINVGSTAITIFVYCQWHFNHTIFEGIITPFHFDYFIKKIADTTPPTLKIKKIQTITHATICISLRQFNRTRLVKLGFYSVNNRLESIFVNKLGLAKDRK